MEHKLICPYCNKVLAKRSCLDLRITRTSIGGNAWKTWERIFHFFTGCIIEADWSNVKKPCSCEPPAK